VPNIYELFTQFYLPERERGLNFKSRSRKSEPVSALSLRGRFFDIEKCSAWSEEGMGERLMSGDRGRVNARSTVCDAGGPRAN